VIIGLCGVPLAKGVDPIGVTAAGGVFPFGFGRKASPDPLTVVAGVVPCDVDDGNVGGKSLMTQLGRLGVGVLGLIGEEGVSLRGDLGAGNPEPLRDFDVVARAFLFAAVFVARNATHFERAGGDPVVDELVGEINVRLACRRFGFGRLGRLDDDL